MPQRTKFGARAAIGAPTFGIEETAPRARAPRAAMRGMAAAMPPGTSAIGAIASIEPRADAPAEASPFGSVM